MTSSDNRRVTADFPLCSANVAAGWPAGGHGGNGASNTERTGRHLWTAVHKFSPPRQAPFTRSPAERYGSKSEVTSVLKSEVLLLLAAPSMPEEVREEIEARAAAGETITVAEALRLKREAKAAREAAARLEAEQRKAAETARAALENAVRQAREAQQMSGQMAEAIGAFLAPRVDADRHADALSGNHPRIDATGQPAPQGRAGPPSAPGHRPVASPT